MNTIAPRFGKDAEPNFLKVGQLRLNVDAAPKAAEEAKKADDDVLKIIKFEEKTETVLKKKRQLTEGELADIAKGKKQWLGELFVSLKTPVWKLMADPRKKAVLIGADTASRNHLYPILPASFGIDFLARTVGQPLLNFISREAPKSTTDNLIAHALTNKAVLAGNWVQDQSGKVVGQIGDSLKEGISQTAGDITSSVKAGVAEGFKEGLSATGHWIGEGLQAVGHRIGDGFTFLGKNAFAAAADPKMWIGAGLASTLIGGAGGALSFFRQKQQNDTLEEMVERLPENPTYWNLLSDDVLRKERELLTKQGFFDNQPERSFERFTIRKLIPGLSPVPSQLLPTSSKTSDK
jgi:hypothetical protein